LARHSHGRVHYELVPSATAEIAAEIGANILFGDFLSAVQKVDDGQHHSWSAESALERMVIPESLLNWM
jgi:hypothetical protein